MCKKITQILYIFSLAVSILSTVIMLALMMIVVIGRYFFNTVPAWSEELALMAMSWLGLMSAAVIEHEHGHIRISVLDKFYPSFLLHIFMVLRWILKLILCSAMTYYGYQIATTTKGMMASLELSDGWNYWPGFLTGAIIVAFLLLRSKEDVVNIWKKPGGMIDD